MGEALAIRLALELAISKGWAKIICEGDCLLVINAFNGSSAPVSSIDEDSLSVTNSLSVCEFSWVPGELNGFAHNVAK
ncbi:hypothetical protein L484_009538 [Morus notabilis]|uniref:RNase H type-1 domain-containing protein n=1 Tax=Morus notabilis TaxID=981085 RepID=W9SHX6_9ROSA|nr:hypothetical protein L484_009538 [Morus notabilis]